MAGLKKWRKFDRLFGLSLALLSGFLSFEIQASTSLQFKKEAQVFQKEQDADTFYTQIEVHNENSALRSVWIKTNSENRILGFHLDWKDLPVRRRAALYSRNLPEPIHKLNSLSGNTSSKDYVLARLSNPSATGFKVLDQEDIENTLPSELNPAQRRELRQNWRQIYFGYHELNANDAQNDLSHLKQTKKVPTEKFISQLSSGEFEDFNQLALRDLQDRSTFVATQFELMGSGRRSHLNILEFSDFPQSPEPIRQNFFWPSYLEAFCHP